MNTVYDIFKNFNEIKTLNFKILKEEFKMENYILFRVYKRDATNNSFKYLGLSYILPRSLNINIEDIASFYDQRENKNLVQIHPSATLYPFHNLIEILLTNYLKNEVQNYYNKKEIQKR